MACLCDVELEVVLVAEVNTVYPRRVEAICLSILTLTILEVVVCVNVVHEASLVVLRNEAELTVSHLSVCWHVDSVVVVAVVVHVVYGHVRIVVATAPCLIDEAEVVSALIVCGERSNETVWSYVHTVVEGNIVRTLTCWNVCEGRLSVRARERSDLL